MNDPTDSAAPATSAPATATPANGAPEGPGPGSVRWPGLVAAALLTVWSLATMARDLMWFDTGELALVAVQFGLGHPPGQPLYTAVAGLAARIPGLDPLLALNALSAICAGLCALPADALARHAAPTLAPAVRCVCLLAIGVLVPLWDQASRIEVYAPATLGVLLLLAGGARAAGGDGARVDDRARVWLGLGAIAGLVACINPVFAIAGALAAGLAALPGLVRGGAIPTMRAIGAAAAGGILGLLPYAYVAAVVGHHDRLIWGEWASADDVIGYLTGRDYAHTDHQAWGMIPDNLGTWLGWCLEHGVLPAVVLGGAGWLLTPWLRRRAALWGLPVLAGVVFSFGLAIFEPDVPDYQSYLAPALWMLAVGLAGLLGRLSPSLALPAAAVVLMFGAVAGERPLTARDRAAVDLPRRLAEAWLAEVPDSGILIVASDHLVFPLLYLQQAEGQRPDVVLINAGWAASGWHWAMLQRQHPDLARIELAAPDNGTRLRRLLLAERDRPARVESIGLAAQVGIRPCAATWGFALGPACEAATDDPGRFQAGIDGGWRGPAGRDPISRRVLAWSGQTRAAGIWALGDASAALRALRTGAPPDIGDLPVPAGLRAPPRVPLDPGPVLIGDPALNLLLGAEALDALGQPAAATAWRAALEHI